MIKRILCTVGLVISLAVFSFGLYQYVKYLEEAKRAEESFRVLKDVAVVDDEDNKPVADGGNENESRKKRKQELERLHALNEDCIGWITIDGTKIDYPVMYAPDNEDYYLKHDFDKKYSIYGVPYVEEACEVKKPSDNIIIYGHRMNNGSMFAGLSGYESREFYKEHKTIRFDTLWHQDKYEVVAVFKTVGAGGFSYYGFTDAKDEDDFNSFMEKVKELSLYDTGVDTAYKDKLITLSTCEYSRKNGRLVVVAKRME